MSSTIAMFSAHSHDETDDYSIQSNKRRRPNEYEIEHPDNQSGGEEYDTLSYYSLWCLFFILGTFNNFGYVVVLSAAKSLADCFHQSNLIGVEAWALIGVGFFIKSLNAFYLEGISHRIRGYIAGITFLIGYALLSLSVYIDFWFAIFAILCIGTACSLGESVILGYCKLFPPKMSGAWSSGTGMAGLAGAGLYLLLGEVLKFTNQGIFLLMTPTSLIYIVAIELSWRSPLRAPFTSTEKEESRMANEPLLIDHEYHDGLDPNDSIYHDGIDSINGLSASEDRNSNHMVMAKESQWQQIQRCFMMSWYRNVTLFFVYIFEYVISVGLAQIANTNRPQARQDLDFVLLGVCVL